METTLFGMAKDVCALLAGYCISCVNALSKSAPPELAYVELAGSTLIWVNWLQPANTSAPMELTLAGMLTLVRPVDTNASLPREVTLPGIVTPARPANANASLPI